jgi:hypothetical protein
MLFQKQIICLKKQSSHPSLQTPNFSTISYLHFLISLIFAPTTPFRLFLRPTIWTSISGIRRHNLKVRAVRRMAICLKLVYASEDFVGCVSTEERGVLFSAHLVSKALSLFRVGEVWLRLRDAGIVCRGGKIYRFWLLCLNYLKGFSFFDIILLCAGFPGSNSVQRLGFSC